MFAEKNFFVGPKLCSRIEAQVCNLIVSSTVIRESVFFPDEDLEFVLGG